MSSIEETVLVEATTRWHAERLERLRAEDGWLTLVGLHWLAEGANSIGTEPDADVHYEGFGHEVVGTLWLERGALRLQAAPGVSIAGLPLDEQLVSDAASAPTHLQLGTVRFYVIKRGERFGVRIKDAASALRRDFSGVERFPVQTAWRIDAAYETAGVGEQVEVDTLIGTVEETDVAGWAVFEHDGMHCRMMLSAGSDPDEFFVVFGDMTNAEETYGGGRFLIAKRSDEGERVILDFNRAYNPPCVFTPYATCPLPVADNQLGFAVTAGEKVWGAGHAP